MSGRLMQIGKRKIIIKNCDDVRIAESGVKLKVTSKEALNKARIDFTHSSVVSAPQAQSLRLFGENV